jgi:hypothetical protein
MIFLALRFNFEAKGKNGRNRIPCKRILGWKFIGWHRLNRKKTSRFEGVFDPAAKEAGLEVNERKTNYLVASRSQQTQVRFLRSANTILSVLPFTLFQFIPQNWLKLFHLLRKWRDYPQIWAIQFLYRTLDLVEDWGMNWKRFNMRG